MSTIERRQPSLEVVGRLLETNDEISFADPVKLPEKDKQFWFNNPPEAVVVASASVRKALLVLWELLGSSFQIPDFLSQLQINLPEDLWQLSMLDFQRAIEAHIANGDGLLKRPIELAKVAGVPIYFVPQNGETDNNENPVAESRAKIDDVRTMDCFSGHDCIFVASDTVGEIENAQGRSRRGKPRKEPTFPVQREDMSDDEFAIELDIFRMGYILEVYTNAEIDLGDWMTQYSKQAQAAKKEFEKILINLDLSLDPVTDRHINALVMQRGEAWVQLTTELELPIPIAAEILKTLEVYSESGAGALIQQLVFRIEQLAQQIPTRPGQEERPHVITNKSFRRMVGWRNPDQQQHALITHFMGVPSTLFFAALHKLQRELEKA